MRSTEVLIDAIGRVSENVHTVLDDITAVQLAYRVTSQSNSIAWLVWHLTRVQDAQVADVAGTEQVWTSGGWFEAFGLPLPPGDTGYGHSPQDVGKVVVTDPALLRDYYDATHRATLEYLSGLTDADLDWIVDERWNPPVTLGVRLVSIVDDDAQHVGQAAYVKGAT